VTLRRLAATASITCVHERRRVVGVELDVGGFAPGGHAPPYLAALIRANHGAEPAAQSVTIASALDRAALLAAPIDFAGVVLPRPTRSFGKALRVLHQAFRPSGPNVLQKVYPPDLQDVINEAVQMGIVAERKMSLENHSIKAGKSGYNQGCELRDKPIDALHGVHLMVGL
jgi:hypothetical protein